MTAQFPHGSRWDDKEGGRVLVVATPGEKVSVVRPVKGKPGRNTIEQYGAEDFVTRFVRVDEVEEAKKLSASELVFTLIDWKAVQHDARLNAGHAGHAERVEFYRARYEAASAELDARLPRRA